MTNSKSPFESAVFDPALLGRFFVIRQREVGPINAPQPILIADPARIWLRIYPNAVGVIAGYTFTVGGTGIGHPPWIPDSLQGLELKWGDVGPLCGLDWYIQGLISPVTLSIFEVCYVPQQAKADTKHRSRNSAGSIPTGRFNPRRRHAAD